jgi:hypothetical protein
MAAQTGLTQSAVSRIWRAFGLKPHAVQSWKLSTDPQFVDKVRDVVGLSMAPPENALVLAVDEKSNIQALDRSAPILPTTSSTPRCPRTHWRCRTRRVSGNAGTPGGGSTPSPPTARELTTHNTRNSFTAARMSSSGKSESRENSRSLPHVVIQHRVITVGAALAEVHTLATHVSQSTY